MASRYSSVYNSGNPHEANSNYWRTASFSSTYTKSSLPRERRPYKALQCLTSFYNAKIITVEPVIFLFMFAYYFYKVVFELYVFNRLGRETIQEHNEYNITTFNHCLTTQDINNFTWTNSSSTPPGNTVETRLAHLTLIVGVTARLPSAVTTLIFGPISDRFAGLRGMCGGIAGIFTACYSYIADVSSKKWLIVRLGLLEAMTFAAGTLSLVTAGVWTQLNNCSFGPLVWVTLGCMVVAIPYTLFLLPESQDKEDIKEEKRPKPQAGPKALLRGLQIFFGRGYPRCKLWLLLLVMIVTILNTTGTMAIITLFLLHDPIEWTPIHIGGYLATSEMMHGLALVVVLPLLVCMGIKDSLIAIIGLILSIGANVSLGFADKTWQIYTIGAILSVDALILPGVKAMMTKTVQPVDHGALFSFVSAAQVLASVLGFAVFVPVYTMSLAIDWYHASGLSFLIMAALYGCMLPIMMVVWCLQRREESAPPPSPQSPPHMITSPSITSPPRLTGEHEKLFTHVQSELGQDILERRSLFGSFGASTELERSCQSSRSGSFRSYY
ncbi:lysosomal proton-coupled steroid conjugate and bile acid symporter SLC46A3-like isoform X2 [Halichondria panicea]|uniref:lysosomal proton-coupled steroid conjugate and bile acid symporter SLC46A3-like isoform X2 n=1 Tax=Halichondria panicea TaxID=6063 RepID=UPI00312B9B3C